MTLFENIYFLYLTAKIALSALKISNNSQCIVVTGESGAGKTISINHLVQFLCSANNVDFMKKAVHISSILEAFGNCQTPHNRNSSRFIKFVQVKLPFLQK